VLFVSLNQNDISPSLSSKTTACCQLLLLLLLLLLFKNTRRWSKKNKDIIVAGMNTNPGGVPT